MQSQLKKVAVFLSALLLMGSALVGSASALPTYSIYGYTNSLVVEDGAEGQGFGFFTLLLTGGTLESATHISGLNASFTFMQDTDPLYGYDPNIEFLPGGGTSYTGSFAETFDLVFDGTNILLEDPAADVTNLLTLNNATPPLTSTFDFLTYTGPFFFDFLGGPDYGEMIGTNLDDGFIVAFTVDQASYVATPEPSTFALIAFGLCGIGFLRARRRTVV